VVCIENWEYGPAIVKHRAWKGHDLDAEVVVAPHLDRRGVGIVDLEFLQLSQQEAIVVPASAEISPPQSVLAHFLYLPALVASEVVIDSLGAPPWVVHKGLVVEVVVSLVVIPPPSSLSLSSPSPLHLAWLAAAIADSSGQGRLSF
jgi:hypothetical protein